MLVNRDVSHTNRVLLDTGPAVRQAVDVLHHLGHRGVAYLAGPPRSWSNTQRRRAAVERTAQVGVELTVVEAKSGTFEAARAAVGELVAAGVTAASSRSTTSWRTG